MVKSKLKYISLAIMIINMVVMLRVCSIVETMSGATVNLLELVEPPEGSNDGPDDPQYNGYQPSDEEERENPYQYQP